MIMSNNKSNLDRIVPNNINSGKSAFVDESFNNDKFFEKKVILKPANEEDIKKKVVNMFNLEK